jgi:hypothetical protein
MKKLTVATLTAVLGVSANFVANADAIKENRYLNDKANVITDTKADCAATVDIVLKATPKNILKAKGEKAVKERIQLGCAYSNGAALGSDLYQKGTAQPSLNGQSLDDLDLFDTAQMMRNGLLRCGKILESEWTKAGRPNLSSEALQDNMLYCIILEGARDGWDYTTKTKAITQ